MLEQHTIICGKESHLRVFPKGDEMIQFKNHEYGFKRIFTGYADFESILENTDEKIQCPQCITSFDNSENNKCAQSYSIETKYIEQ